MLIQVYLAFAAFDGRKLKNACRNPATERHPADSFNTIQYLNIVS